VALSGCNRSLEGTCSARLKPCPDCDLKGVLQQALVISAGPWSPAGYPRSGTTAKAGPSGRNDPLDRCVLRMTAKSSGFCLRASAALTPAIRA